MKVGYTFVLRLALLAFAPAQAFYKNWLLLPVWLLLGFQAAGFTPSTNAPVVVPFRLVGNTMFVQATINGQAGDFLFDTGASDLILNSAHFEGFDLLSDNTDVVGLYGELLETGNFEAHEIALSGTPVAAGVALVLDLTPLERIKKMPIAGIFGYAVLKDFELQIDFNCQQITLFPLRRNGQSLRPGPGSPMDSFEFKMSGHIPYLNVRLGGKTFRMGIDSGSERNILQADVLEAQQFESTGYLRLAGLTQQEKRQEKGFVKDFTIDGWEIGEMEVVLTDFRRASAELPVRLHGILGVDFLKDYKVAINYRLRKIYFWQSPEQSSEECLLAECKP